MVQVRTRKESDWEAPTEWIVAKRTWSAGGALGKIRFAHYELVLFPVYSDTNVERIEDDYQVLGKASDWKGAMVILEEFTAWQHTRIARGEVLPD